MQSIYKHDKVRKASNRCMSTICHAWVKISEYDCCCGRRERATKIYIGACNKNKEYFN